ncbi:VOC family protein [Shewanella sp. 202IG2-18]|nr:VOC family protein [Parashewanella hymeniacidonis]
MTQGLNHLGLTVKNLDASTDFFVNTLGWNNVGGYPDYPSAFVIDGKLFLTLWQTKADKPTVNFDRKHNVGLHHLALTVASLEDLHQLHEMFLRTKDVVIEFAPEPNNGGPTIHMMIREPSDNRIEFAYRPK